MRRRKHLLPIGKAQIEGMADVICRAAYEKWQAAPSGAGVIIQKSRERAAAGAKG